MSFVFLAICLSVTTVTIAFQSIDLSSALPGTSGFQIGGNTQYERAGTGVNSAGDFNHDGIADLMLSSPQGPDVVYLLFGKSGSAPFSTINAGTFTTSSTTGFRMVGGGAYGLTSCVGLGDFNGGGIDDIAVSGVYGNAPGKSGAGVVFVIYGRTTAAANIDLSTFSASLTNGFKIYGENAGDALGYQLASIGDFNGDGHKDLLVLCQNYASSRFNAYVIFGTTSRTTNLDLSALTADTDGFRILSTSYSTLIYTVGDVNNDGYDDVGIADIGAAYTAAGRGNCGIVNIVFGHSTATAFPDLTLSAITSGTGAVRIFGAFVNAKLGVAAGSGGDYNHDGRHDLVVSDLYYTYIIFGLQGVTSYTDIDLSTYLSSNSNAGQKITTSDGGPGVVGSPGDVDGDGITDLYISVPTYSSSKGALYVVKGHTSATSFADLTISASSSTGLALLMTGGASGDTFGAAVAVVGADYNKDGGPDLLIGAPHATANGLTQAGAAYVFYGVPVPDQPSSQPSARPSSQPSSHPSSQPSTQPSVSALQLMLASPTYKVRNGFAFAAIGADGKAKAWGEAPYGGDASAVQSSLDTTTVATLAATRFAFAAVHADGSLDLWGLESSTTGLDRYGALSYAVAGLVANEAAFAGVDTATGRVIAVGSQYHGGDVLDDAYCNGYSTQLSAGVRSITASSGAFAAIKMDGTLVCWGNKHAGADPATATWTLLHEAKLVAATRSAFAVLLSDGTVASWGDRFAGGDSSAVSAQLREVHHLTASRTCFVAFKKSSGIVVWGYGKHGGDTSAVAAALSSHVIYVAHTFTAMAALKADGTVVAWGEQKSGGDASAVQTNLLDIKSIVANIKAFAALTSLGGVVTWGRADYGGSIPSDKVDALSSGVVSIQHTDRAFAALKILNGAVVVWGVAGHGGSPGAAVENLLTSGVHTICANDVAFSAIKTDGKVVAWGHTVSVPTAGVQFTSSSLAAGAQCA